MSTIIDTYGRVKAVGDQTLVQGPLTPYGKDIIVKALCTAGLDASNNATLPWTSVLYDTAGFIASIPSTNIVIPYSGFYSIIAYLCAGDSAHKGQLAIMHNGVEVHYERVDFPAANGIINALNVGVSWYYLSKGDLITVVWNTDAYIANFTTGEQTISCTVWRQA